MSYNDHVVGFSGERVGTRGYIDLYTTFGLEGANKTLKIRYLVINANTSYNILLGRSSLNKLWSDRLHTSPSNEVPFPLRRHPDHTCRSKGRPRVRRRKLASRVHTTGAQRQPFAQAKDRRPWKKPPPTLTPTKEGHHHGRSGSQGSRAKT